MAKSLPNMFNLTEMTGRQSAGERQVTMMTFDMARRTQLIIIGAGLPGLLISALLFPLLGIWSTLALPLFLGAGFYFFHLKSQDGLEQRKYKQFLTKYKSRNNNFMRGMEEVTIGQFKMDWIVRTVGEVPFEMLNPDIQKLVDRDRWEREEQDRYMQKVQDENGLKAERRAKDQAIAEQAQAKLERKYTRRTRTGLNASSLKTKLRRAKSEDTEDNDEG